MKKGEIQKIIKESLELEKLDEAYMAQPKIYDLNTELLLSKTKDAHEELYHSYVQAFNNASAKLDTIKKEEADSKGSEFRSEKLAEQYNMNATYLHELYFANISDPYSEINVDSIAHMRLNRDFGNFQEWQLDFYATCMSAREGWAICGLSTYLKKYINIVVDSHDMHGLIGFYPCIVMDMHYHAHRDYLNKKNEYYVAMMRELNWHVIEGRFERADLIVKALESGGKDKWT